MTDKAFMIRAISLALLGKGFTNPNPMVGAVIVREDEKGGQIVAEGYHHKCGDLHAERDALKNAGDAGVDVKGCTAYVTLEPCCHFGKQPPCTQALIESGIKKVVIGSRDPNPLVSGKGVKLLEEAGIEVVQDFMRDECDAINPVFFHFITKKRPYVIVKYAMTADGQTATSSGESKWITAEKARENVHGTRSEVMAVMCGIGTAVKDDPMLNVRLSNGKPVRQPVRVVLDSLLQISEDSKLVKTAVGEQAGKVIVFCRRNNDKKYAEKKLRLEQKGVEVLEIEEKSSGKGLNLRAVLKILGEKGIDSVLVESGGALNAGLFFEEKEGEEPLVNEVHVYIAPKIFGNDGKTIYAPVRGLGVDLPADCVKLSAPEISVFGDDVLLKYKVIDR